MPNFTTREELSSRLSTLLGDREDDEALNFIADSLNTFDAMSANAGGISQEEHKRLMEEQDNSWRKRYKDAFLTGKHDSAFDGADSPVMPNRNTSRKDPAEDLPGGNPDNPASYDALFSAK